MKRRLFFLPKVKGFTLVELLVVIGILGMLGAALLTTLNPVVQLQKSRDTRRKADLKQIQNALELYTQDVGHYPLDGTFLTGASWKVGTTTYMGTMPKDPQNTINNYAYQTDATGSYYQLYAPLERDTDPQICPLSGGTHKCPGVTGPTSCGSGVCSFGVASSNTNP